MIAFLHFLTLRLLLRSTHHFPITQWFAPKWIFSAARNADLIKLAERFNYFDAPAWDINHTLPNVYDAIEFCRMAFVPQKIRSQKEAHCYFSSHSIHAENFLNTAKRRQRDNNITERLEKNLADSLQLDKTVNLNLFAGLTLTEAF